MQEIVTLKLELSRFSHSNTDTITADASAYAFEEVQSDILSVNSNDWDMVSDKDDESKEVDNVEAGSMQLLNHNTFVRIDPNICSTGVSLMHLMLLIPSF